MGLDQSSVTPLFYKSIDPKIRKIPGIPMTTR